MPAATGAPATLVKYGMSKVGVAVLQGSVSRSDLHLYRDRPGRPAMPLTHSHTLSLSLIAHKGTRDAARSSRLGRTRTPRSHTHLPGGDHTHTVHVPLRHQVQGWSWSSVWSDSIPPQSTLPRALPPQRNSASSELMSDVSRCEVWPSLVRVAPPRNAKAHACRNGRSRSICI